MVRMAGIRPQLMQFLAHFRQYTREITSAKIYLYWRKDWCLYVNFSWWFDLYIAIFVSNILLTCSYVVAIK